MSPRRSFITVLFVLVLTSCAALVAFPDVPAIGPDASATTDSSRAPEAGAPRRDAGLRDGTAADRGATDARGDRGVDVGSGSGSGSSDSPSCRAGDAGVANCGSAGSESCCTSLALTAGTFDRSYRYVADAAIDAADPATISGVKLDKYEVTVGRFRQYENQMNDGGLGTPSAGEGKHTYLNGGAGLVNVGDGGAGGGTPSYEPGWVTADKAYFMPTPMHLQCDVVDGSANVGTWTPSVGGNESLPINCVNWFEAYAFCIWDGGFLPTEAEWEYAAAGGSQLREYPWGSTAPGTTNHYAIYDCLFGATSDAACTRDNVSFSSIAPVGTAAAGDGPWGQVDLAGNLFEWTLDTFQPTYIDPCTDCANLSASATPASQSRVIRGGAFNQGSGSLLSARRQASGAQNRSPAIGFRCARAP